MALRILCLESDEEVSACPEHLVGEVLAFGTVRAVTMPIYAAKGVAWQWLVDLDQHTLEVFRLRDGRCVMENARQEVDEVVAAPFVELRFSPADVWVPTT
ncbi:MAG: Uma2 family endonuclease [Methylotetracoccus sp.]